MTIKKWGIYRANLDPVVGSEQGKSRPVMVVSENVINNLLNAINVLPITSLKPNRTIYPNEALLEQEKCGLPNESIVLCHQIRTIDKKRISLQYGSVDDSSKQSEIIEALCFQLGM
jgi:mRNA interferase MazF